MRDHDELLDDLMGKIVGKYHKRLEGVVGFFQETVKIGRNVGSTSTKIGQASVASQGSSSGEEDREARRITRHVGSQTTSSLCQPADETFTKLHEKRNP